MHLLKTPSRGFAEAGSTEGTDDRTFRRRMALPAAAFVLALLAAAAAPAQEATPSATPTPGVQAAPASPASSGAEQEVVETADPGGLSTPGLEQELANTIAELRRRVETAEAGSEAADTLDREIDEVTNLVRGRTRRALSSWSSAGSEEAEQQAWERVVVLEHALDALVALRRLNGARLSPGYIEQRTGLGREGRRQLASELDHVVLKARLYKAHRLHDMERLPARLADLVSVGELVWHLLLAILVAAAAGWLKRRGPDVLERLRQAAFHSFGRLAWKRRVLRVTNAVEALLPWGSFVLGVVALRWALGPIAGQVEVDVALRLALLYGGYRLAIDGAAALLAGIGRHYRLRVDDATFLRLRRSVRTVLRIVVLLIVVALVSSRWLGQGALYLLVERFAWLVILAAILGELFRWRASMVEAYLELSPDGPMASSVRDSRDRWYGIFLAPAAFVWLAFHGLATVVRDFALRFDETQKALAYLFRRKVEKQAEREGYADENYDDVPPEVVEAFDESAVDRGPLVVAHFPELETLQAQVSQWRKSGVGGSALVRGERGVGKTTWLNQLRREDVDIVRIELGRRILEPGALVAVLAERLEVAGDPGGVAELADRLEAGPQRVVVLDLAQHLFLARIGGYDAFTAFAELVNRTRHRVFWIAAAAEYAWRHLRAVHPDWAVFRREIALKGWPEERIRELIRTRSKASGVTFNYADVAVDHLEGVTRRARLVESADGYLRLLWDYSDGNPRVALHFFVRSLDPDRGDRLRVRLFRAPDPSLLEAGGEAGLFVLAAIVTHESISSDDLAQVTRSSVSQCHIHVDRLIDLGAARIDNGLVRITTTWQRAAIRLLRRRNLLPG